jgi:hypothetical protein
MGERLMIIGKQPDLTAPLEMVSWEAISRVFQTAYYASRDELVTACKKHSHTLTAEGFVDYCLEHGWLREVTIDVEGKTRG